MKFGSVYLLFAGVVFFSSCSNEKLDRLTLQNDSLRMELRKAQAVIGNFSAITASLDSLEGLRKVVSSGTRPDAPHAVMASRIHEINRHVLETDKKINSLGKELKSTQFENSGYLMMVDALKSELEIRVSEVSVLEGTITDVEQMNEDVKWEKEQAVSMLLTEVGEKKVALAGLEDRLHKLEFNFRNTEAEAVYARAVAVEESARKTRFAPGKKKESLAEALELYKKAKSLGKTEAEANIRALQKSEPLRSLAVSELTNSGSRTF